MLRECDEVISTLNVRKTQGPSLSYFFLPHGEKVMVEDEKESASSVEGAS